MVIRESEDEPKSMLAYNITNVFWLWLILRLLQKIDLHVKYLDSVSSCTLQLLISQN